MSRLSLDRLNFDTMPEGNSALDAVGRRTRVRVVPGGVSVHPVTNDHVVVAGYTLPVASRVTVTWAQVLLTHVTEGEVLIALDDDCVGAVGDDSAVPGRTVALRCGLLGLGRQDSA